MPAAGDRRGPGRLCLRHPGRPARHRHVVVEAKQLGGTCLNVGCIPSKALIHAADEFEKVARIAAGASPLGISAGKPELDLSKTMLWKDGIVGRLDQWRFGTAEEGGGEGR